MSDAGWSTEFGSVEDEVRRLVVALDATWAALPTGADPLTVAAQVLAPRRRGARQLSDGAMRTLVGAGLVALVQEAEITMMLPAQFAGAARQVNWFRVIVQESAGSSAFPGLLALANTTLDDVPPDPATFEALAALGLAGLWQEARGGSAD